MEIRDMRKRIGLTQEAFSKKYHIPVQTLKQWESSPKSKSHRKPPEYVPLLLERLISQEYDVNFGVLTRTENLELAARLSRGSSKQWLRYLGKEFEEHKESFSSEQIDYLQKSEKLSMVQKVFFKRAMEDGTAVNKYARSLDLRGKTPMVDKLVKGRSK